MAEEKAPIIASTTVVVLILLFILGGIIIAIPIVYVLGKGNGAVVVSFNVSDDYTKNECTQATPSTQVIQYLVDQEPFPYKYFTHRYRPGVIVKQVSLIFGFRHDNRSWSIDQLSVVDMTSLVDIIQDGDFESNYLRQQYSQCILSSTRSSTSDILFDLPYHGDFYYNDQTNVGMTYLIQPLQVTGGRYYNISYYLENRGYANNSFLVLVGWT